MDMKINSKLIVSLRKNKGWSQHQLSIVSGVSLRTVQRVENEGNASVETLKSLASAFEIDFKRLVSKPNTYHKKLVAPLLLFFSLAISIFVTSTTTAAPGVEIRSESVLVSPDQAVTTFTGGVTMLVPNVVDFEISTANNKSYPHQLVVNAENTTFLALNAQITKTQEGLEIEAKEIEVRTQ